MLVVGARKRIRFMCNLDRKIQKMGDGMHCLPLGQGLESSSLLVSFITGTIPSRTAAGCRRRDTESHLWTYSLCKNLPQQHIPRAPALRFRGLVALHQVPACPSCCSHLSQLSCCCCWGLKASSSWKLPWLTLSCPVHVCSRD